MLDETEGKHDAVPTQTPSAEIRTVGESNLAWAAAVDDADIAALVALEAADPDIAAVIEALEAASAAEKHKKVKHKKGNHRSQKSEHRDTLFMADLYERLT